MSPTAVNSQGALTGPYPAASRRFRESRTLQMASEGNFIISVQPYCGLLVAEGNPPGVRDVRRWRMSFVTYIMVFEVQRMTIPSGSVIFELGRFVIVIYQRS